MKTAVHQAAMIAMPSSALNSARAWRQGRKVSATPSTQSEVKCFCGALGVVG